MLKIRFISTNYIILFELKDIPVHHFSVFLSYVHFCDKNMFFSFNKDENWFAALTKVAILKAKLLAGNDHVIDIFTSEEIWKISHCVFSVPYCQLCNKSYYYYHHHHHHDYYHCRCYC